MKRNSICLGLLLLTGLAYGQNPETYADEAFRSSNISLTGTARFRGIGGNHTALGGDASSIFGNPAGLGFYNRSELSISPSFNLLNANASFLNTSQTLASTKASVGNLSVVLAGNSQNTNRRWRRTGLGLSYSQQINFGNEYAFGGRNTRTSIVDSYIEAADRRNVTGGQLDQDYNVNDEQSSTIEGAAYQFFLINGTERPNGESGPPYFRFDRNRPVDQSNSFTSSGAASQWSIGYAGNYDDKLYIGVSGSLTRLRYRSDNVFSEQVVSGTVFNGYRQQDELSISGSGFNAAIGLIYKLNPDIQVGASLTSPTWTRVSETFTQRLTVDPRDPNLPITRNEIDVVPNQFDYRITSPLRASGGATYFLNKGRLGFITASADYVGYPGMRVSTGIFNAQDNQAFREDVRNVVQNTFRSVVNLRAGAEIRANLLRIRGGIAYLPDPFLSQQDDIDRTRLIVTGGLGVRNERFFLDASGAFNTFKSAFTPYTLESTRDFPSARIDNRLVNITVSAGVFF